MRPSEPTTTGTATSSDWAAKPSPKRSLRPGASGLSSAHAQKFTKKPIVARARFRFAPQPSAERPGVVAADAAVIGLVIIVHLGHSMWVGPPTRGGSGAARAGVVCPGCGRPRTDG